MMTFSISIGTSNSCPKPPASPAPWFAYGPWDFPPLRSACLHPEPASIELRRRLDGSVDPGAWYLALKRLGRQWGTHHEPRCEPWCWNIDLHDWAIFRVKVNIPYSTWGSSSAVMNPDFHGFLAFLLNSFPYWRAINYDY